MNGDTFPTDAALEPAAATASQVIAQWPSGVPFDADEVLRAHPEFRENKSVLLDIAYEEFCRRTEEGEDVTAQELRERFPEIQKSLERLVEVHCLLDDISLSAGEALSLPWPEVGERFLDLEIVEPLGLGAFSRVFLTRQLKLGGRIVVAKICPSAEREASVLGQLDHPRIVPVLSVGTDPENGLSAICMPFLGRATLLDVLDRMKKDVLERIEKKDGFVDPTSVLKRITEVNGGGSSEKIDPKTVRRGWKGTWEDAAADIGFQLGGALQYAHAEGVCHGDIKPSNVLVGADGSVRLFDFNLSFRTAGGILLAGGTLPYMAPEQLSRFGRVPEGEKLLRPDERSDLFSLGALLYEQLTGELPFGTSLTGDSARGSMTHAAGRQSALQKRGFRPLQEVNGRIDAALAQAVEKCLALDPQQRWQSAGEFLQALSQRQRPVRRMARWSRRYRRTVLAAAAGGLVCLGTATAWQVTREPLDVQLLREASEAFKAEDYARAEQQLGELLRIEPGNTEALFWQGRSLMLQGRYEDARSVFRRCGDAHPDDRRNFACRAHCIASEARETSDPAVRKAKYRTAIGLYRRAAQGTGVARDAIQHNIGCCYLGLRELDDAEKHFRMAVDLNPRLQPTLFQLARLNLAQAMHVNSEKNQDLDLQYITQALACGDPNAEICLEAACCYAAALRMDLAINKDEERLFHENFLKNCRRAVDLGLPPEKLDKVITFYPGLNNDPDYLRILNQPAAAVSYRPVERLVDPLSAESGLDVAMR